MLSLKQMQDSGLSKMFSDKEAEKHLQAALAQQQANLAQTSKTSVSSLESVLERGGSCEYKVQGKKYKVSVLTAKQMKFMDNLGSVDYSSSSEGLPPVYKFHITTSLGHTLTVKAKTHVEAQSVVDGIFGKGRYRVSASRL